MLDGKRAKTNYTDNAAETSSGKAVQRTSTDTH